SEDKWLQLVEASWKIEKEGYSAPQPVLSMEDLKYINSIILSIDVSKVKHTLIKMYAVLEDQGIHLTDRRKGKVLKTIAAHALLNGRTTAVEEDLAVLKYVAPSTREEAEKVYIILLEELGTRERLMSELQEIEDNLREVKALLLKTKDFDPRLVEYLRGLEKARERINRIIESTTDDNIRARSQDILAELTEVIDEVRRRLLV
ncbi:MAG: MoxR family ATPase, partial [Thermosphaera sp.]